MLYIKNVWFRFCLITVAEAEWKTVPLLAGKGSARPDWLYVLGNQALHIKHRFPIMDPQEVPADFKGF